MKDPQTRQEYREPLDVDADRGTFSSEEQAELAQMQVRSQISTGTEGTHRNIESLLQNAA